MTDIDRAWIGCARLDADELARPWTWRDAPMSVRYALYRTLEDAQEAYVAAAATPHPESRRILALAQRAFGDLRGMLEGLPPELLDKAPREGEWSVREVLRHVLLIERRYAAQTQYALERVDSDPVRIPEDRMPTAGQVDASGDVGAILARIADLRADTDHRLGDVAAEAMTRPTIWVHYRIDVRFRLHRFAAHIAEHALQCEKTLAALGWRETEGRRIVRRIRALLGEVEGLGATAAARAVEASLADRFASIETAVAGAHATR